MSSRFNASLYKTRLLYYMRKRSPKHNLRVYFVDRGCRLVFVKKNLFNDEIFVIKMSPMDYSTCRAYLKDGGFVIYQGKVHPLVDFILSLKNDWVVVERCLI
ncbi:hypothetical protein [Streptococcus equinus]|uniref:hypothetical protein n=1 Tax=Streptococcus equinus TaxID=1335 RepID=UPI00051ABAE4|nr:hypothetical protein [Streptococcus equinus]